MFLVVTKSQHLKKKNMVSALYDFYLHFESVNNNIVRSYCETPPPVNKSQRHTLSIR